MIGSIDTYGINQWCYSIREKTNHYSGILYKNKKIQFIIVDIV